MRARRRRSGGAEDESEKGKESVSKKPVMFLEQVDYKMQIDDVESDEKEMKPINTEPNEEDKHKAFKKKLGNFS